MRGPFMFILGVIFSGFLFSMIYLKDNRIRDYQNSEAIIETRVQRSSRVELVKSVDKCDCVSEKSGKTYNFCYKDPQNANSVGKKFSCDHLPILEKLNILEPSGSFVDLTDIAENSKNLIFASAASDDHFQNEVGTISAIYKYYPDAKFILYSLGLQAANISKLKSMFKNLEVRVFNTIGYPDYTNHWMEYRFKPLLLAELLREHSNIWWMDAHLSVKKPNMVELMMKEVAEKTKKSETKVTVSIYFFIYSSHSNFATLNTALLDYFPTNSIGLLKDPNLGSQMGANTIYMARTQYTMETLKWPKNVSKSAMEKVLRIDKNSGKNGSERR